MVNRRDFLKGLSIFSALAVFFSPWKLLFAQGHPINHLRDLIAGTRAQLLLPGENAYATFRRIFNLRLNPTPAAILRGDSEEAIQRTIQWAQENNYPLHCRAGGHSFEGFSSGPGVVIDVRPFQKLEIDSIRAIARVGAGHILENLSAELYRHGFALPTGSCPTVGVAGLTLGGGVGLSSRHWGLTCDQLRAVRVILADGQIVWASDTEHSDLFWALRGGGGGQFGVITEFEFNLKRALDAYTFVVKWPASEFNRVMTNWQELVQNGSTQVSSILKLVGTSQGVGEVKLVGQILSANNQSVPSEREARALLNPYLVGRTSQVNLRRRNFLAAAQYFSGGEDPPVRFKAKSSYAYQELSEEGMNSIRRQLENIPRGSAVAIIFDSYGGAIGNKTSSETAFFHREALYSVQYYCQWADNSTLEATNQISLMRRIFNEVDRYFSGYSYSNYCDADLNNPLERYYGDNLSRLIQIKNSYDPERIFKNSMQNLV